MMHFKQNNRFNNRNRVPKRNSFGRKKFNGREQSGVDLERAIQAMNVVNEGKILTTENEYLPQHSFSDFAISDLLKVNILKKYQKPMPIQDQVIPAVLSGQDVIGIANTGTGKTAAFLIPLIDKVFKDKSQRVFIIAPTRELAVQIADELYSLAKGMGIFSAICIGGVNINKQISQLRQNPHFVIGTPGRIKDLLNERKLHLAWFSTVVLDETDRMVDIGFLPDIRYFISLLPKNRQSLFFSATVPEKVKEIINSFVNNPVTISVKQKDSIDGIRQEIIKIQKDRNKMDQLHDLLACEGFEKVLIFGRTKWGVQKMTDELVRRGFRAGAIHGNKKQNQRQRVLDQFKRNDITILLATDVASRGLDIPDVSHVINYDIPATFEDYIHRIGRTGRANKKGVALTFIE